MKNNKTLNSIFDRDYMMKECLKYVDANRQRLKNDRPWKYWFINQDLYISLTTILWLIWQAWVISAIFSRPTSSVPTDQINFYLQTAFYKLGTIKGSSSVNSDIVTVVFRVESYVFLAYTIVLVFLSIYTVAVVDYYIFEIKKAVTVNKVKTWTVKINLFMIVSHVLVVYGMIMLAWIIVSLFYIPFSLASQGFTNLIYVIPPNNQPISGQPYNFSHSGFALIVANFVNLIFLIALYLHYLKQRFVGYRFFFSFEKKEWKKIDYVGQTMKTTEKHKLNRQNKPHRGKRLALNNKDMIIELKGVNKYFITNNLKFHALKNVDLKIKEGEFVVILGPSGSGKTTLLNIISGVDRPTSGEIVVANNNMINMNSVALTKFRREKIGYIFQQYSLLPNLTVKENIMIGYYLGQTRNKQLEKQRFRTEFKNAKGQMRYKTLQKRLIDIIKSSSYKNKVVDEVIQLLGLNAHAAKYPSQLSGGQQQRVAIARAFVKHPDILFGDEPTGAIDEEMAKQILELFYLINKISKTTIVMVTHNPIIAEMGTRIIEVHNGIITRNQVITNPKKVEELDWSH